MSNFKDPYQILGISPTASDDEVKAAYRDLAKKYHPDNYADNPLSELAQEKMQEINEAYDTIIRTRKQGGASGNSYTSYGAGNRYSGYGNSRYRDIRALIQQGRIADAETLLDGTPAGNRDAEWHFLKASVLYRKGWHEEAYQHFATAARMEPGNPEYQAAFNRMEQQRRTGDYGGYGGTMMGCGPCDLCSGLLLLDCCCRGCR